MRVSLRKKFIERFSKKNFNCLPPLFGSQRNIKILIQRELACIFYKEYSLINDEAEVLKYSFSDDIEKKKFHNRKFFWVFYRQ